jgi:predicted DNA-binding transcriptional regulator AlpA
MEKLLTTREVAALLGVRERTVVVWRGRKRGPAWLRLGGNTGRSPVRYRESDVLGWLEQQRVGH